MQAHIEKEYKMMLTQEAFESLLKRFDFNCKSQINEYFNTSSKDKGMRIREVDHQYIFTLKEFKNNQTYEYEKVLNKPSLNDPELLKLFDTLKIKDAHSLGKMQTTRYCINLTHGELCLDHSLYLGKEDYELEYELYDEVDDFDEILKLLNIPFISNKKTKLGRFIERRQSMKIAILCANGVEECEALIVYDLLKRANLNAELVSINETLEVTSSHNLTFKCESLLQDFNEADYSALVLPGGLPGTDHLYASADVLKLVSSFNQEKKLITAICAAPSIFIKEGLLKDEEFVCYPSFEQGLKAKEGVKVVVKDNIITAKALGAGFEFAYEIIKALKDEESAQAVFKQIHY